MDMNPSFGKSGGSCKQSSGLQIEASSVSGLPGKSCVRFRWIQGRLWPLTWPSQRAVSFENHRSPPHMNKTPRRQFLRAFALSAAGGIAVNRATSQPVASSSRPKLVGVACSPRQGKSTRAAVQLALDAAKEAYPELDVELIDLAGLKIPGELAAGLPLEPGQIDDFPSVAGKLADPRVVGLLVGTPVYMGSMSALCKAFLDRCIVFRRDWALRDKVAGALAVGGSRNGGQDTTVLAVLAALMRQDVIVVGDGKPIGHPGATLQSQQESIASDETGCASAKGLGRRVAEVALRLAAKPANH
jgi:multimeric flavodoxin WrbA